MAVPVESVISAEAMAKLAELAEADPKLTRLLASVRTSASSPVSAPPPPCRFRGESLTGHERHALDLSSVDWAPCHHPAKPLGPYVCPCKGCRPGCPGYTAPVPDLVVASRWRLTDPRGVLPPDPPAGAYFNASLTVFGGRRLLAFRTGWAGSRIHLAELDAEYHPVTCRTLHELRHATAHGCEDPRFFVFRDRLHVAYTGYADGRTSVLYARLTDDLRVERVFPLSYPKRQAWEKNWAFFEADGSLWCVYESLPDHRILRVTDGYAEDAFDTPNPFPWSGGYHRGGASPVRVGGDFYHFHHGAWDLGPAWPTRRYNLGLTVFDAAPPFRVRWQTPDPLLVADPATRPGDQYCDVVFPGGAIRDGDGWVVSVGVHDRWTEFVRFAAQ